MTPREIIEQLEDLKLHCETMTEGGDNWEKDIAALEYAIKMIERKEKYREL